MSSRSASAAPDRTLDYAARSVLGTLAPSSQAEGDLKTFVAERALRHCWEGLRQYLAIRVPSPALGAVLLDLESFADRGLLSEPPSARAHLFRRAHERAALPADARPTPRWWRPPSARHAKDLERLRAALRDDDDADAFEIAELTFARRLDAAEVAFVIRRPPASVEEVIASIRDVARRILGPYPASRSGQLDDALLEAFALEPSARRPRARPLLPLGAVVAERYRVDTHLGSGAFADVYRAADLEVPGHVVALKLFRAPSVDEDAREIALRELRLIASVSHPSVVQFKDHGWHDDRFFFVMPFHRGQTLRERLATGPLNRAEARRIFVPLAHALAAMHDAGVRHQDVKPDNILLAQLHAGDDESLLPVLLDLGVAAKDAESVLAGTPTHLAPEVAARFAREPDPPAITGKADVFSLALTLKNALAPEEEETVLAGAVDAFVADRARRAPRPPSRPDLRFLRDSFERWLHLAPDERPTAHELARELARLTAPEEQRARRLAAMRWGLPVLVMLAVVFGAVVFVLGRETELQRIEATQARELATLERLRAEEARDRAARVRADLAEAHERRLALEADVERLQAEYTTSRLTREELASKLAHAERGLALVREEGAMEVARVQGELRRMRESRDLTLGELDRAGEVLRAEQGRANALRAQVETLSAELAEAQTSSRAATRRVGVLEQTLSALRASLDDLDHPHPADGEP